jgi:hypothetical protein
MPLHQAEWSLSVARQSKYSLLLLASTELTECTNSSGEVVDFNLDDLKDPEVVETVHYMLKDFSAECKHWTTVAAEHWAEGRMGDAKDVLELGVQRELLKRLASEAKSHRLLEWAWRCCCSSSHSHHACSFAFRAFQISTQSDSSGCS